MIDIKHTQVRSIEVQSPWWVGYRRQQYKPRPTVSLKKILRKNFFLILKEYAQQCSVAGVRQMINPNLTWEKRCGWIGIFIFLLSTVFYFLSYTWRTTMANPLILMPSYSTYSIADIDYPAIALCSVNRLSRRAINAKALMLYKTKKLGNATVEKIEKYLLNSGRLLDFTPMENWDPFFVHIERFSHQQHSLLSQNVIDGLKDLTPDCKDMLLRCTWAGVQVDCMSIFQTRRTAKGHCCAFNYVLDFDEFGYPNNTQTAKRQTLPGFMHGLNVIADPLLDDYAYPLDYFPGFDVLLFESTHFADPSAGRVIQRLAEPNRVDFLELKSFKQTASNEVRKYPLTTRKCIFQDEMKTEYHNLYSYSACIIRCRVKFLLSMCQCTPYFLPRSIEDGPVCLLSDLDCLIKYKEKLTNINPTQDDQQDDRDVGDSLNCPDCLPDCENTRHVTKSYKTSTTTFSVDKYFAYGFAQDINMTGKCVLSIYYASPTGDIERLDVISYWYQIISSIGGFGGVLIGASVFTLVEIMYFLVRYTQVVYWDYTA